MSGRRLLVFASLALALLASGCVTPAEASPTCDEGGRNTLVLMAQAIPGAEQVPCIAALPAGWVVHHVEVKSGHARVDLGTDASGNPAAVVMRFVPECDTSEAVEVPSDDRLARRFEDVDDVASGYRGTSYYVFDGGCASLTFNLAGEGWSALVNDAAAAFSLTQRRDLERYIREYSNGVIENL